MDPSHAEAQAAAADRTSIRSSLEERYPIPEVKSTWLEKLIFLGTGTSGQVPAIHCITPDSDDEEDAHAHTNGGAHEDHRLKHITCPACADAVRYGDESPNRRMCTGAIVTGSSKKNAAPGRQGTQSDDELTIMIDCGPTFYSSAIRVFPEHGLRRIDACLITHAHADAILGLDHLRAWTLGRVVQSYVDVYLTQETMNTVEGMFPYLVDRRKATGGGGVGALRWHIIDSTKPFVVKRNPAGAPDNERETPSVTVTPLSVLHGFKDRSQPFEFVGFRIEDMSYISDCVSASSLATHSVC